MKSVCLLRLTPMVTFDWYYKRNVLYVLINNNTCLACLAFRSFNLFFRKIQKDELQSCPNVGKPDVVNTHILTIWHLSDLSCCGRSFQAACMFYEPIAPFNNKNNTKRKEKVHLLLLSLILWYPDTHTHTHIGGVDIPGRAGSVLSESNRLHRTRVPPTERDKGILHLPC